MAKRTVYDFGDGSKNTISHSYGTSTVDPLYWVTPTGATSIIPPNNSAPAYSGVSWKDRDTGNVWYNFILDVANKLTPQVAGENFTWGGDTTRKASFTLNQEHQYAFYAWAYTDEDDDCNFGEIKIFVDGVARTPQYCINNGIIQPMFLISRCMTDHSSHNNDLATILNGGLSARDTWGLNLRWAFLFVTIPGHNITGVQFRYVNMESGLWKLCDTTSSGFPCLGWHEEADYIYKGARDLSAIMLGAKEIIAVFFRGQQLWGGGVPKPTPTVVWSYETDNSYNEVDILYTTDIHLSWKGSGNPAYYLPQTFSLSEVGGYKDKLWNNNIPAFLVDCGDFIHGNGNQESVRDAMINFFNNCGSVGYKKYLAVTYGNHEWYAAVGTTDKIMSYLNRIDSMTACNLFAGGQLAFSAYKAIRIGNKKIGIIGVGYPSPNGRDGTTSDVRFFEGYTFYDARQTTSLNPDSALYKQVQGYIDFLKNENGFDYIIVITHMNKYSDESFTDDERFNARADLLIKNTKGIDVVIPGHNNMYIYESFTYQGLDGKSGVIVPEAGCGLHSFGRLRIKLNTNTIEAYLLDSLDDLEVI